MALETLIDIVKIDGFNVTHIKDEVNELINIYTPVLIDYPQNAITFVLQNGAIKENGVNGCQVDTIIHAAKLIISGLNDKFPCEENLDAIKHLNYALLHLNQRRKRREELGIEGTSNEQ